MKNSFFADTKLQIDLIKEKIELNFNKPLFILKLNLFKSQNDHKLSGIKQDAIIWSFFGSQLDLSLLNFDLKCSFL